MSLEAGFRLGPYEVVSSLGAGGMGEVYRARDRTLNRDVALKVLPDSFASDPDRLARFEREAQLLASLGHPNIGAIHGLEHSNNVRALVLELVEGPTLADRIADGPVPMDEALAIASQIAEALAAAHELGIVHRDLKPANVEIRPDGIVKVLDFGLAKVLDPAGESAHVSEGATVTSPAMTRAGMILGTASYMSPEQARGYSVDRGADIWAWGSILFEMLAGERAFGGADNAEVLAAVIRGEPAWSRLPADTPQSVHRMLRRCLEKDRKRRFADIRDVRFAIEDAAIEPPLLSAAAIPANRRERVAWVVALLACIAGAGGLLWRANAPQSRQSPSEMRVEIATPPTTDLVSMAISPDGEKLVFVASSEGRPVLWLRSLVTGERRPLAGTDGASFPFWSTDSRSIGFFTNGYLYRVDADGGSLKALAPAPVGAGGTWNRDGVILFTQVPDAPISRVSDTGTELDKDVPGSESGKGGNRFPQFLPGGHRYLYYVAETAVRGVYVGTLDGPERRRLFDADSAAAFVPPAQILFVRAGTLFAQRFDTAALALEGDPVPLAKGVAVDSTGAAAISGSAEGSIAYRIGSANRQRQLVWFDRSGRQIGGVFPPDSASPLNPALSPNQRQLALNRTIAGNADIWVLDLDAGTR